jgi:hypothetical protein
MLKFIKIDYTTNTAYEFNGFDKNFFYSDGDMN